MTSDVQSPSAKLQSFGGYRKPDLPDTAPAQALDLLPSEATLKDLGNGLGSDSLTLTEQSSEQPKNGQEPSQIEKAYQAIKDCPVKPMKWGVQVNFKL